MAIFKDFFNKMTYGFVAFFLLSFAMGAMEEVAIDDGNVSSDDIFFLSESEPPQLKKIDFLQVGGAHPDPGFNIETREISFNNVKFCAIDSEMDGKDNFVNLQGIKTASLKIMLKNNLLSEKEAIEAWSQTATTQNLAKRRWDAFRLILNNNDKKRVVGETAAVIFFDHLGYIPLPAQKHYTEDDYSRLNQCNTQNASNNGIDGIFIHYTEKGGKPSHIIINEAKFNKKSELHFGTKVVKSRTVSQSHSEWNRANFDLVECIKGSLGEYKNQTIIRTATLLNPTGEIKLYEVRDAGDKNYDGGINDFIRKTYALQLPLQLSLLPQLPSDFLSEPLKGNISTLNLNGKLTELSYSYSQFQKNIGVKGYTLQ